MRRITALCWFGAAVVAMAACDDDDDDHGGVDEIGECKDIQGHFWACGGDPGGYWEADGYCAEPGDIGMAPWEDDCRYEDVDAYVNLYYYASVDIDYDYVHFDQTETRYEGRVDAHDECLDYIGVHQCDDLEDLWFWYMSKSDVNCKKHGDGCRCEFDYVEHGNAEDYVYYLQDGIMYLEDPYGVLYSYPYCVGKDYRMAWSLEDFGYDALVIFDLK